MITTVLALISSEQILPYLYGAFALALVAFGVVTLQRRKARAGSSTPAAAAVPRDRPQMLLSAFDRTNVGIGFLGGDGQWLDANRRLLSILGYSKTELGTLPMRLLTHPEDRKRETSMFADLRSGKRASYTMSKRLQKKGGEYRSVRVQMLRCAETPQPVFQCTVEEEGPHGSQVEALSRALADVHETAVILCDATGTITGWNAGAEKLFGYPEHDAVGMGWAKLHVSETRESLMRIIASAAREGFARTLNTRRRSDETTVVVRSVLVADLLRGDASGFLEICHPEESAAPARP
jgi:PAS domain S-box-containing protein